MEEVFFGIIDTNERSRVWYRRERAGILAVLGGKCEKCGATEHLEVHHRNPLNSSRKTNGAVRGMRGGMARIREWRSPDARERFILLCRDCHAEEH